MRVIKPVVFVLALIPFGVLLYDGFTGGLSANPVEDITHRTGEWTLIILLVALAVTPIRIVTGWNRVIQLRRMVGLFALFYASLHFLTYLVLDLFFYLPEVVEDVVERPYITVGFTAFLILVALGVTSTKKMVKRMGGKRWNRLHSLIYVAGGLGVFHFLWLVKADTREPEILGYILMALLAIRFVPKRRKPRAASSPAPRALAGEA